MDDILCDFMKWAMSELEECSRPQICIAIGPRSKEYDKYVERANQWLASTFDSCHVHNARGELLTADKVLTLCHGVRVLSISHAEWIFKQHIEMLIREFSGDLLLLHVSDVAFLTRKQWRYLREQGYFDQCMYTPEYKPGGTQVTVFGLPCLTFKGYRAPRDNCCDCAPGQCTSPFVVKHFHPDIAYVHKYEHIGNAEDYDKEFLVSTETWVGSKLKPEEMDDVSACAYYKHATPDPLFHCEFCSEGTCANRPDKINLHLDCLGIVDTGERGLGVIALKPIQKGDFLLEFKGIIGNVGWKDEEKGYIMEMGANHVLTKGVGSLVNHSCRNFNCVANKFADRLHKTERVFLMAHKEISPGEELSWTYSDKHRKDGSLLGELGCLCSACKKGNEEEEMLPVVLPASEQLEKP